MSSLPPLYRRNRNRNTIFAFTGRDISSDSEENYNFFRHQLSAGEAFLTTCIDETSQQKILSPVEKEQYQKSHFIGPFIKNEWRLYKFIIENLTIQTATAHLDDIKENGNFLLSLKERERRKKRPVQGRTPHTQGLSDNLYYVTGIGKHPNAPRLRHDYWIKTLSINLNQLGEQDADILKSLWVSAHESDVVASRHSDPVLLGNTRYSFSLNAKERTIHYRIERCDENMSLSWEIPVSHLTFCGKHVLSGLAYQFILLLRLVGGSYRTHILNIIDSNDEIEKQKILSVAMTALMPGWMTCEAKVPVMMDLNKPYINIYTQEEVATFYHNPERPTLKDIFAAAIKDEPNEQKKAQLHTIIEKSNAQNFHPSRMVVIINTLITKSKEPEWLDLCLSIGAPITADKYVRYLPNVNCREDEEGDFWGQICLYGGDKAPGMFACLLAHGLKTSLYDITYLNTAIIHNNFNVALAIVQQESFTPITTPIATNSLFLCLKQWYNKKDKFNAALIKDLKLLISALVKKGYSADTAIEGVTILDFLMSADMIDGVELMLALDAKMEETQFFKTYFPIAIIPPYYYLLNEWRSNDTVGLVLKPAKMSAELMRVISGKHPALLDTEEKMWACLHALQSDFGLTPEQVIDQIESFSFKGEEIIKHAVVIMVTGLTPKSKQPYVILGKRRLCKSGKLQGEYVFPGGLIEQHEEPLDAALRELREEAGINLKAAVENGTVHPKTYQYDGVQVFEEYHSVIMNITFVHFEVGTVLEAQRVYAQDDLFSAAKVKFSELNSLNDEAWYLGHTQIIMSNAYWLTHILTKTTPDEKVLRHLLEIESYIEESYNCSDQFLQAMQPEPANKSWFVSRESPIDLKTREYLSNPQALIDIANYWPAIIVITYVLYPGIVMQPETLKKILLTADSGVLNFLQSKNVSFVSVSQEDRMKIAKHYVSLGKMECIDRLDLPPVFVETLVKDSHKMKRCKTIDNETSPSKSLFWYQKEELPTVEKNVTIYKETLKK